MPLWLNRIVSNEGFHEDILASAQISVMESAPSSEIRSVRHACYSLGRCPVSKKVLFAMGRRKLIIRQSNTIRHESVLSRPSEPNVEAVLPDSLFCVEL